MPTPRELMDPQGTLPSVEFKVLESEIFNEGGYNHDSVAIVTDGKTIGFLGLVSLHDRREMHFNGIEIGGDDAPGGDEYRDKGYGMACYVHAIELAHSQGVPFTTQPYEQSKHSKKIWERLAAAGVADVITPFESVDDDPEDPQYFEGRFVVYPPTV